MSTAVKRACDACHRRKVKCDGINPCRNCSSAQLACTYNAIPQKKGPKGSRAKVISELRETQRQSSISSKMHGRVAGSIVAPVATLAPTPGILPSDLVKTSIAFFFSNMYPSMPILNRQRLEQEAMSADTTYDTYCLLSSLCAFMLLQPGMSVPGADPYATENMLGASIATATLLLDETVRVRKGYDHTQKPTLNTLVTSYFLFACYYGLDMHDKAWLSLRDATSLVHLVCMNKDETYLAWDSTESSCRRRLYWLLFVAERAYALQHDRPLSLRACISPPSVADESNFSLGTQLVTFSRIVALFRPFDGPFVDLWNKTRSDCPSAHLETLRKQHGDVIAALAAADPQLGDKVLNQRWLQALTWQINITNGNNASPGSENYQYPTIDVSREIVPMAASFSTQGNPNLLASGLMEALVTITSNLVDVLSLLPSSGNPFTTGPREHLDQLSNILAMLRVGEYRFTPLLLAKVHEILPRLASPMLQNPPELACELDIFDGFGNAGMAQPPCLNMDDIKTEGSGSVGAPSLPDATSPFTSPPSILSPGMDFASEFSPMSDMVMQQHPIITNGISPLSQVRSQSRSIQQALPATAQLQLQMQAQPPQRQQQLQQQQSKQPQPQTQQQHQHQHQHQHMQHMQQTPYPNQPLVHTRIPQQPLPQHPQQSPVMLIQGMGQGQMHAQVTPDMGVPGQATDSDALCCQRFNSPMSDMNVRASLASNPQSQRSPSFTMPSQQYRTMGDYQALRVDSDINSLGALGMNSLSSEMDFGNLR